MIAANIAHYRRRRRWSQRTLGAALGVSFQQIGKFERAENQIMAGQLYRVSIALDVPFETLFKPLPR